MLIYVMLDYVMLDYVGLKINIFVLVDYCLMFDSEKLELAFLTLRN
jgi:hypothetical protein